MCPYAPIGGMRALTPIVFSTWGDIAYSAHYSPRYVTGNPGHLDRCDVAPGLLQRICPFSVSAPVFFIRSNPEDFRLFRELSARVFFPNRAPFGRSPRVIPPVPSRGLLSPGWLGRFSPIRDNYAIDGHRIDPGGFRRPPNRDVVIKTRGSARRVFCDPDRTPVRPY